MRSNGKDEIHKLSGRVYIADDDAQFRDLLVRRAEMMDLSVLEVEDGNEASEAFEAERFDLREIQRDKKLFHKTFDEPAHPLVAPGSCCGSTETPVYGAFKSTLTFSATQTQTPTTSQSLTQAVLVSTWLTLTVTPSLAPSSMPTPTPFDLPSPVPPSVLTSKNEPMMTRSEEHRA